MAHPATPPPSDSGSDDSNTPDFLISVRQFPPSPLSSQLSTPCASPHPHRSTFHIPPTLTQETVNVTPQLKRLQQDLLILTSFPDNTTLSWRPSWFAAPSSPSAYWTLHNPPHVVTEVLPKSDGAGPSKVMTRRLRKEHDEGARWMRTNGDWDRYCDLYGVPYDFLNEDQVRLMRMGLPIWEGTHCAPVLFPMYPEPARCDYVLGGGSNLPRDFHGVGFDSDECIVVGPDGVLRVEEVGIAARYGNPGRWSYVPWTREQEVSCQPLTVKLRFWNSAMEVGR